MQIQPNERDKIAFYLGKKLSLRKISRQLSRSPSSISEMRLIEIFIIIFILQLKLKEELILII